ncbi:hypothetical protein GCM10029992_59520 [Glycomyces albus]
MLADRVQQQVAGVDDASGDEDDAGVDEVDHVGGGVAEVVADGVEGRERDSVAGAGRLGGLAAGDGLGVASGEFEQDLGLVGVFLGAFLAALVRALPEAYCSRQPVRPQPQERPPGMTERMCPISAATPWVPRSRLSLTTTPPPTPVPMV